MEDPAFGVAVSASMRYAVICGQSWQLVLLRLVCLYRKGLGGVPSGTHMFPVLRFRLAGPLWVGLAMVYWHIKIPFSLDRTVGNSCFDEIMLWHAGGWG